MHVVYVVSVVNGPCAGVLPSYKFTAFQAVNLYGGSALAYVPCTGIYIQYKSHAGFILANIIMARRALIG